MDKELLFVRKVVDLFQGKGLDAIDLGCGYGRNTLFLEKNGFKVTAVDKNMDCLINIKSYSDQITAIHTDLINFKFDKKYDFILCTFVLHFLKKDMVKKLIKDMAEHLKDSGILAIALIETSRGLNIRELQDGLSDLSTISLVEKTIHDEPHTGAEHPHNHEVIFYIGTKQ